MSEVKFNNQRLELLESNLYAKGSLVQFNDDVQELERDSVTWEGDISDIHYTVMYDDTIDKIAWKFYKDVVEFPERYWWVIADANGIENPLDLTDVIGKDIVIPNLLFFKAVAK